MIRCRSLRLTVLVFCLCLLFLGGCVRTKPSKFYRLSAVVSVGSTIPAADAEPDFVVGVGPVKLPQYLDRPHMVTSASGNEYEIHEFDRWAEPLGDNIASVLGEDLSKLLGPDRVTVFPWIDATGIDYQVVVEVISFEGKPGGKVVLNAQWKIIGVKEEKELLRRKSSLSGSAGGEGYDALVAAQSRLLGDLSAEIEQAIQGLGQNAVGQEKSVLEEGQSE